MYSVSALLELWRGAVCKVDAYPVDLILTPSQSVVIRNIESKDRTAVETKPRNPLRFGIIEGGRKRVLHTFMDKTQ